MTGGSGRALRAPVATGAERDLGRCAGARQSRGLDGTLVYVTVTGVILGGSRELLVALTAVGATVPWQGVLLAYALGQPVASIPLLPGGGGSVEASLVFGLVAYGGTSGALVAGAILFRVVSACGIVPIGWAVWALASRRRSADLAV